MFSNRYARSVSAISIWDRMLPAAFILGGGLNALSTLRSLGRRRVPVVIFDTKDKDISYQSRFARHVRLVSHDDESQVAQIIAEARRCPDKPVLFISGDKYLLLACKHEQQLREHLVILLPSLGSAEIVVNKERFQSFAESRGAPVPRGFSPTSVAEVQALSTALRYPVALKPRHSLDWQTPNLIAEFSQAKMILAIDPHELMYQWSRVNTLTGPPVIQEFIRGDDSAHYSFVSYRNRDGMELASLCVQKLRIHPIHYGAATLCRVAPQPDMEEIGRRMLDELKYRNVASVCFKRDVVSGKAYIFEINGRLPLSHGIFQISGIDLPWLIYRDALRLPCEPQHACPGGQWIALSHDMWAALEYRRAGELRFRDWLLSLAQVRMIVELDPRDLGPFWYFLRGLVRRALSAIRKRL